MSIIDYILAPFALLYGIFTTEVEEQLPMATKNQEVLNVDEYRNVQRLDEYRDKREAKK